MKHGMEYESVGVPIWQYCRVSVGSYYFKALVLKKASVIVVPE